MESYERKLLPNWMFLLLLFVSQATKSTAQTGSSSCPQPGWRLFRNSCYLWVTNERNIDWNAAISRCTNRGAHLVDIQDEDEWKFVTNNAVPNAGQYRIGITDEATEGNWKHAVDDSNVTFFRWKAGEPNGGRTENCGTFESGQTFPGQYGLYNDGPCSFEYRAYVCKKTAESSVQQPISTITTPTPAPVQMSQLQTTRVEQPSIAATSTVILSETTRAPQSSTKTTGSIKPTHTAAVKGYKFPVCEESGRVVSARLEYCTSKLFLDLLKKFTALLKGDKITSTVAKNTLSDLAKATDVVNGSLHEGDIVATVEMLQLTVLYNIDYKSNSLTGPEDRSNFLQTASNVLDDSNTKMLLNLQQAGHNTTEDLVKAVEQYGFQAAQHLAVEKSTKQQQQHNTTILTKNIGMQLLRSKAEEERSVKTNGVGFTFKDSAINLSPIFFQSTSDKEPFLVVNIIYSTLGNVFKRMTSQRLLRSEGRVRGATLRTPDTTVVSSSVRPLPQKHFVEFPVKITLQQKYVSPNNANISCVFWRNGLPPAWSTKGCRFQGFHEGQIVCECNHLTIFAALIDPIDTEIPVKHKMALEYISTAGCSVSLISAVLTIVMTLCYWPLLKGTRVIILINLCVAIGAACALVLVEPLARDHQLGCTVVASLLHFFLLAMFSWMLCQAVLYYYKIVVVNFKGKGTRKIKYFVAFGWGFPAALVGLSIGLTKTRGHGGPRSCWLSTSDGLIWAFIAPALTVISINFVVLVLVLRKMMNTQFAARKCQTEKLKIGVRAMAVMLPLLGVTWLFGVLALSDARVFIKYLFTICNSLQGLLIFIFHCLQIQQVVQRKSKSKRLKCASPVVSTLTGGVKSSRDSRTVTSSTHEIKLSKPVGKNAEKLLYNTKF